MTEFLGLYQAELARVLGVRCQDVGRLGCGEWVLQQGTHPWAQAELLVRLFEALFELQQGEESAMHRWLRVDQQPLGAVPLLLMVDDGQIERVVRDLEARLEAEAAKS
ncbi:MAG: hypothetical protein AMJ69_04750 [Gammaproteobacteria bacterium SG8_47]|nr:MAG: hypothetical protein AMJ69_04750 [Gammaproteobacteria bacterium SG8_47]